LKYLRYAIGEIVLVVIGILIALQINNWNEGRKNRIIERDILTEIAESLEINAKALNNSIDIGNRNIVNRQFYLDLVLEKPPYDESMQEHF